MKGDNELGYIAKADAIRAVIDMLHPYLELEDAAFKVFDAIPTVDYVPIVRCKDCIMFENADVNIPLCIPWCYRTGRAASPKDFCSYGERRENYATEK